MADAGAVMNRLDGLAQRLDACSKAGAEAEDALDDLAERYERFVDKYETGLWDTHVNDEAKLPSEAMRLKLAHRAMDPELLGAYMKALRRRKKAEKRVSNLKAAVSAQQSLLSALKEEMVATR